MKIRRTNKKQPFKKKFISRKLKFNRNRKTSKNAAKMYKGGVEGSSQKQSSVVAKTVGPIEIEAQLIAKKREKEERDKLEKEEKTRLEEEKSRLQKEALRDAQIREERKARQSQNNSSQKNVKIELDKEQRDRDLDSRIEMARLASSRPISYVAF